MISRSVAVGVGLVALTPYLGLAVPFELGLRLQALLILTVVGTLGLAWRHRLVARVKRLPRIVRIGLALYAGAALWGGMVGLVSGSPVRNLLGQLLSMLLLPAGAVVFAAAPRGLGRSMAAGLAAAASVALGIHLGAAALGLDSPAAARLPSLFKLPHGADFVAPALLATLLAAAWWLAERSAPALAGALAGVVLMVGGMSRAQWTVAVLALVILAILRPWSPRRTLVVVGTLALLGVIGGFGLLAVARSGDVLVRDGMGVGEGAGAAAGGASGVTAMTILQGGSHHARSLARIDLPTGIQALEARILLRGPREGAATLWVAGREGPHGTVMERWEASTIGTGAWREVPLVVRLPDGVRWVGVGVRASDGEWEIDGLEVTGFRSSVVSWLRQLGWRVWSLRSVLAAPRSVGTLRYRIREWEGVRDEWLQASWPRVLVGQGLGAVFFFENVGWDDQGRRIWLQQANYIHNFYVFLGFKLGLAGLAALGGLLLVSGWIAARAWKLRRRPESWFLAAAASSWIAYLLWSFTSPEILNFRMAPLWGAVVAAACRGATKGCGSGCANGGEVG